MGSVLACTQSQVPRTQRSFRDEGTENRYSNERRKFKFRASARRRSAKQASRGSSDPLDARAPSADTRGYRVARPQAARRVRVGRTGRPWPWDLGVACTAFYVPVWARSVPPRAPQARSGARTWTITGIYSKRTDYSHGATTRFALYTTRPTNATRSEHRNHGCTTHATCVLDSLTAAES